MTALKSHEQASILGTFVPPGVIMPFAGATAPAGWLLCNGSAISTTTYASLYAAISTAWGNPGGGTFNIPDLRGRFCRSVDGGIARDPDRATRTASNSGGNTGDNVGSVQTNATKKNGLAVNTAEVMRSDNSQILGCAGSGNSRHVKFSDTTGSYSDYQYEVHPTLTNGDNETRPLNANVNYIIKY